MNIAVENGIGKRTGFPELYKATFIRIDVFRPKFRVTVPDIQFIGIIRERVHSFVMRTVYPAAVIHLNFAVLVNFITQKSAREKIQIIYFVRNFIGMVYKIKRSIFGANTGLIAQFLPGIAVIGIPRADIIVETKGA